MVKKEEKLILIKGFSRRECLLMLHSLSVNSDLCNDLEVKASLLKLRDKIRYYKRKIWGFD